MRIAQSLLARPHHLHHRRRHVDLSTGRQQSTGIGEHTDIDDADGAPPALRDASLYFHSPRTPARACVALLQLLLSRLLPRVDHSPHVDHSPAATMVWGNGGNGGNGGSSNWVWELGHPRRARQCRARHCRARHCRARHCRPPPRPPSPSHAPSSPSPHPASPRPPPPPSPPPPWPLPCLPPPPTTTAALATATTAALATAAPATAALATPTPTSPPPPSPPLPAIATADDHRLLGDARAMASFDGLAAGGGARCGLGIGLGGEAGQGHCCVLTQ